MIKLSNFFKKEATRTPGKLSNLMDGEIPEMKVKEGRATTTSKSMEFYEKYQKRSKPKAINEAKVNMEDEAPMIMSSSNKTRLRSGIIVSLEFKVKRPDLEFVGISRIDGKPIYLFTGNDFSGFNLPYEEVFASPEDMVKSVDYTDWLTRGESINSNSLDINRMKRLAGIR